MTKRYFHWDAVDDCVMHETDGAGATTVEYTHEPGPFGPLLSETRSGVESYHHYDALGSTTALSDPTGALTDTFQYDAWGNQVVRTGTTPTPYTWVGRWGYQHDTPTGGYYIRARSYQPAVARWESMDPKYIVTAFSNITRDSLYYVIENGYSYCTRRPLIIRDPSGYDVIFVDPLNIPCSDCCYNEITEFGSPGGVRICKTPKVRFIHVKGANNGNPKDPPGVRYGYYGQPAADATGGVSHSPLTLRSNVRVGTEHFSGGHCNTIQGVGGNIRGLQNKGAAVEVQLLDFKAGSYDVALTIRTTLAAVAFGRSEASVRALGTIQQSTQPHGSDGNRIFGAVGPLVDQNVPPGGIPQPSSLIDAWSVTTRVHVPCPTDGVTVLTWIPFPIFVADQGTGSVGIAFGSITVLSVAPV